MTGRWHRLRQITAAERIVFGRAHDQAGRSETASSVSADTETAVAGSVCVGAGNPVSRRQLDHRMKTYGRVAAIPIEKRHFHALKHSIATHLVDAGADIMFIKDWLGHVNIQNTLVYSKLTSRAREEQAKKIFASSRIV